MPAGLTLELRCLFAGEKRVLKKSAVLLIRAFREAPGTGRTNWYLFLRFLVVFRVGQLLFQFLERSSQKPIGSPNFSDRSSLRFTVANPFPGRRLPRPILFQATGPPHSVAPVRDRRLIGLWHCSPFCVTARPRRYLPLPLFHRRWQFAEGGESFSTFVRSSSGGQRAGIETLRSKVAPADRGIWDTTRTFSLRTTKTIRIQNSVTTSRPTA